MNRYHLLVLFLVFTFAFSIKLGGGNTANKDKNADN